MPIDLHLEPLVSHRTTQTDILVERITLRAMCDTYERTTCSLVAEWKLTIRGEGTPVQLILHIKTEFDIVLPPALTRYTQGAATWCTIYTASLQVLQPGNKPWDRGHTFAERQGFRYGVC